MCLVPVREKARRKKKKVAYFQLVFRSGIAILDLMLDWSPVMRLPLIYSFLINISKSFTIETRMRPAAGLPQRITFCPHRGAKKRQIERKVLKRDKYFAINTRGGGNKGGGGGGGGCWGVARSQRSISHRNSPKTLQGQEDGGVTSNGHLKLLTWPLCSSCRNRKRMISVCISNSKHEYKSEKRRWCKITFNKSYKNPAWKLSAITKLLINHVNDVNLNIQMCFRTRYLFNGHFLLCFSEQDLSNSK